MCRRSIKGWLALLDDLSRKQAARVVPGHGPKAMELPGALEPQQRYLAAIVSDVRRLIKEGKTLEDAIRVAGPGSCSTSIMSGTSRQPSQNSSGSDMMREAIQIRTAPCRR